MRSKEPICYGDNSEQIMDVTITLECPNCKNEIETYLTVQGIHEIWEMNTDSEKMPEFMGFEDFIFVHYDPLEVKISSRNLLVEDPTITNLSLLIVVKTRMNKGFCCIGLNLEEGRFYRPIYQDAPHKCCWPQDEPLEVGHFYGFKKKLQDPATQYPHKNDDILVSQKVDKPYGDGFMELDHPGVFEKLEEKAKTNFFSLWNGKAIHDSKTKKVYIREGQNCPSYGVLKVKMSLLKFIRKEGKNGSIMVLLDDKGTIIKLPWTSMDSPLNDIEYMIKDQLKIKDSIVLIFVGLGRGYNGKPFHQWQENRCYSIALGIFTEQSMGIF